MSTMKDSKTKAAFRRNLLRWYRADARDLPWRRTRDPYQIWLSEIMLQQTRVETVIEYYNRFLRNFPTVRKLAAAPEDAVMKLWEGLGYYSRARNLHRAAKQVVAERKGRLPERAEDWRALPGIGRYTAAAIASIGFGEPLAVLDGNVKRVLARLLCIRESIDDVATEARLWDEAQALLAPRAAGDFNQAMMELGARVCLPRNPKCDACPVATPCLARAEGAQEQLPARKKKAATPHHVIVAAAILRGGKYLLGKRPPGGLLGGLWEFPGGKVESGETLEAALAREVREELGMEVRVGRKIAAVKHAYSHFSITLHVFECAPLSGKPKSNFHTTLAWTPRADFSKLAFPKANLKVFEQM